MKTFWYILVCLWQSSSTKGIEGRVDPQTRSNAFAEVQIYNELPWWARFISLLGFLVDVAGNPNLAEEKWEKEEKNSLRGRHRWIYHCFVYNNTSLIQDRSIFIFCRRVRYILAGAVGVVVVYNIIHHW